MAVDAGNVFDKRLAFNRGSPYCLQSAIIAGTSEPFGVSGRFWGGR